MTTAFHNISLTALALTAFAGNSVICRLALGENSIDAAGFTSIRLLSGAITLWLILTLVNRQNPSTTRIRSPIWQQGHIKGALALFIYAVTFSYAYLSLSTATGALVLFGVVQITMISWGIIRGHRPSPVEWVGLIVALIGLILLFAPELNRPTLKGFLLMTLSGLAWAAYSLLGQTSSNPLADTAGHFFKSLLFVMPLTLWAWASFELSQTGVILAILSGAVTSGMGYAIWYTVLPHLRSIDAAVGQLLVPVIAAFGGLLFIQELPNSRLIISALLLLGGVLMVTLNRSRTS